MTNTLRPPLTMATARLALRPVAIDDAAAIFRGYASDPGATRLMNFARHRQPSESAAFVDRCVRCWQDGNAFPWAIVIQETMALAGVIELRLSAPKADFGYILCPAHWGRGYASEAATTVVAWAIAQPEIFRVWATCHPANARSVRVLEKAGLTFEGRLANWEQRPNIGELAGDSLVYAKTRPVTAGAGSA